MRSLFSVAAALAFSGLAFTAGEARAYNISNSATDGCHEAMTAEALRSVRAELTTAAPLPATADEHALIHDLQFIPEPDMGDLGAVTLLLGVRDNDLKGRGADDLVGLAEVHGNPDAQFEHCLRSATQKEPGGSEGAVAACRAFIRGKALEALGGLDAAGAPDPSKVTALAIHLAIRGHVDAPLPTYYVRMGQAIHAIEDSFSHTYRTADGLKITVVLDWLDQVHGTLDEAHDGPGHAVALDLCNDADALRTLRRKLATEAAAAVLRATLDPSKTVDAKMAAVDAALDKYVGFQPGCTFDNHWCDAPEAQYKDSGAPLGCNCNVGRPGGGLGGVLAAAAIALGIAARRASRRRAATAAACGLAILGASLFSASLSFAQGPQAKPAAESPAKAVEPADEHAPPPPPVVVVAQPGPIDPSETAFGAYLGISASIDRPAVAATGGLRLRASKHWAFGLDGEWNPWLALNGYAIHRGVVNVYGSGILRFPLAYEKFNLRTTLSLGASYLLTDFYGAPSGSLGIYGGVSFLGVEWKLSRIVYLIINPLNIALPVPQLRGVPLVYPQYRFTLGLEFYAG